MHKQSPLLAIFGIIIFLIELASSEYFKSSALAQSDFRIAQAEGTLIANRRYGVHRNRRIPIPRGEGDANNEIPYIISPRTTLVLGGNQLIQWNDVSQGSQNYDLAVLDITNDLNKITIWNSIYERDEVCINQVCSITLSDSLNLSSGRSYLVKVVSDDGEFDKSPGISFSLINSEEDALVIDERIAIEAQSLSANATALMIADLYVQHDLFSEALQVLEKVPESQRTAKTNLEIARSYQRIGLVNTAAIFYGTALELATDELDDKAAADAKLGLGLISFSLRERQEALNYLTEAKDTYRQLGDLYFLGETLFALRDATRAIGKLEEADQLLQEAKSVYKALIFELDNTNTDPKSIAEAYSNLGDVYSLLGEQSEAINSYETAMNIYIELGDTETAIEFEEIILDIQSES
ncbi:hypothetical protein C8B47_21865 [filamentous cyanobacterium CCP4]|nr:hypothetical protein C8B47_21865 [filamentous cyanobacterium CCP4]